MQTSVSSLDLLDLKGDLSSFDVICVFGVGDGGVYRQLRSWFQKEGNRFAIFLEEDEELFLKMKESPLGKDPKVRLFFYQEGSDELFKQIAWEFLFLKFGFYARKQVVEEQGEKLKSIFSKITDYHRGIDLFASDFQDMGAAVLKNVIANQRKLAQSLLGQSLQGSCEGMPAIICGAGPSLNQQIPLLASLQDKALIFAGGSAVTALTRQGVSPHFCAHFDSDPPRNRFLAQDAAEIPHFYQSRFSDGLLNVVHAPLLWMAEGGHYPVEKWFRDKYAIDFPQFDTGWTVANFCTATAVLLGCDPIIFVGMEFAVSGQVYASGMDAAEHKEGFVEVENELGEKVLTKYDWLMSAKWQAEFAQQHPEVRFINATAQGLSIQNVEKMNLDEAVLQCCRQQFDFAGIVHSLLQRADRANVSEKQADGACQELIASYRSCDRLCDLMLKCWEKYYPKSPLESSEYSVLEHDLQSEVACEMVLDPLWQIWKRPMLRTSSHPLGNHIQKILFFKRAIEANLRAFS